MVFRHHLLISAAACTPAFFLGCGTLGTYYPKSSAPPVSVSRTDLIEARKLIAGKPPVEQLAENPASAIAAPSEEITPEAEIPFLDLAEEILPVEFEPALDSKVEPALEVNSEPEEMEPEPGLELQPFPEELTSYDGEPSAVPLPAPEADIATLPTTRMTLEQLESLALQHNPSIKQASTAANKASGLRTQVGLRPNPQLSYFADEMGNDSSGGLQGAAISQTFITGGKLDANQCVIDQDYQANLWEAEVQRYRVRTDVKIKFYQALAAQQRMLLAQNFHEVAEKGRDIAQQRFDALEGAKPDVLQTEIQLSEVEIVQRKAEIEYQAAWNELATVIGLPEMAPTNLEGELPLQATERDFESLSQQLLSTSPELQAAYSRVNAARANLNRQDIQAIPNLNGQVGVGQDNFTGNSFANVQLSIPLPIHNRNQGNIQAAYADYCRATQDVARLKLSIRTRLVQSMQNYNQARITVDQYATIILPKAEESMNLSDQAHIAGQFDFLRVLTARRTYFETNLDFVKARAELATAEAHIDGLLLSGGLNAPAEYNRDDALRGQGLSQQ